MTLRVSGRNLSACKTGKREIDGNLSCAGWCSGAYASPTAPRFSYTDNENVRTAARFTHTFVVLRQQTSTNDVDGAFGIQVYEGKRIGRVRVATDFEQATPHGTHSLNGHGSSCLAIDDMPDALVASTG
jgi:hypothetical protein